MVNNLSHLKEAVVNEKQIVEDPRFKISVREMKITVILFFCFYAVLAFLAYSIHPKDPSQMTFVIGLPTYFFWAVFASAALTLVGVIIVVKYVFKEVSLNDYEKEVQ